jgi:hypothetical protein
MLAPQSRYREQQQLLQALAANGHSARNVYQGPWAAAQAQRAAARSRKPKLRWYRLAVLIGILSTSLLLWWALVRAALALVALTG